MNKEDLLKGIKDILEKAFDPNSPSPDTQIKKGEESDEMKEKKEEEEEDEKKKSEKKEDGGDEKKEMKDDKVEKGFNDELLKGFSDAISSIQPNISKAVEDAISPIKAQSNELNEKLEKLEKALLIVANGTHEGIKSYQNLGFLEKSIPEEEASKLDKGTEVLIQGNPMHRDRINALLSKAFENDDLRKAVSDDILNFGGGLPISETGKKALESNFKVKIL